jgi:hypothetical protein
MYMTEQELWENIVHDPSDEKQHQRYANACVENDLEKEALQRYKGLRNIYPAISDKFTKQLTTALEFKLMPVSETANGGVAKNSILGRLSSLIHSLLLTGVLSLGYGYMKKSLLEIMAGLVMIAVYLSYIVNRSNHINRG